MKYLDSTVFLYAAVYQGPKSARAADLLRSISEGEEEAVTASLTLDEVAWQLVRLLGRKTALAGTERLLALPGLHIAPVTRSEIAAALVLMGKHESLPPRDAVHVATATTAGASVLVSDDSDFDGVPGLRREPLD